MTDVVLEAKLFADAGTKQGYRRQIETDWASIHRELKRKHITLSILWDEYVERNREGYCYSRFCQLYRSWEGKLSVPMRQTHVGGDKLFVEYAGDTVPVIIERLTGEVRAAQPPRWRHITALPCCRPGHGGSHHRAMDSGATAPSTVLQPDRAQRCDPQSAQTAQQGAAYRRLGRTRRQLLEELDQPALKPLPIEPYVFERFEAAAPFLDERRRHLVAASAGYGGIAAVAVATGV